MRELKSVVAAWREGPQVRWGIPAREGGESVMMLEDPRHDRISLNLTL